MSGNASDGSSQRTPRSWDKPEQPEDTVCSLADALRADDEVIINNRTNKLRVLGRDEEINRGFLKSDYYPAQIVWLRGNGTEYRIRYGNQREYWPKMHTESQLTTREAFDYKHREKHIKTRASERGKLVRRIEVVGVDDDDLIEWALQRNLSGFEELDQPPIADNSDEQDTGSDRTEGEEGRDFTEDAEGGDST